MGVVSEPAVKVAAPWKAWGPLLPAAAALAPLPYTLVYFLNLWELPHYRFFPLVLIAVAFMAWQRWGGRLGHPGRAFHLLRLALLCGGIAGTLCATLFASAWMGYFGFALSSAAWLGYHQDRETGRSLIVLAVPMFLIWQPPYNTILTGDAILVQSLQSWSARLSSQSLDMLGYAHHQPGTILEFAGRSFGVAEACSGIQSFFAVVCFGAILIAYLRRGPLHSAFLLATCPFWAILMNTIRITSIPIAYTLWGIDISHGLLHDLLGFFTMALAMGLMLSTDELLLKLREWSAEPAPVPTPREGMARSDPRIKTTSGARQFLIAAPLCLVFALFFGIQAYDVSQSWGHQRDVIDFFRDEPLIELRGSDAPPELLGWRQQTYTQVTRASENDDLGQRSDVWYYEAPFGMLSISFDQMFPGWHELTRCYKNSGWKPNRRAIVEASEARGWPVVTVEMTRGNEHGYLVFSLVERSGNPLQPPEDYTYWTILRERLQGRLTPAVRGALFSETAYQVQAFATTYAPLSEVEKRAAVERFMRARDALWTASQRRLPQGGGSDE